VEEQVSRGWVVVRVREDRLQFLGHHDWVGELDEECRIEDEQQALRFVREPGETRVSWEMAERLVAEDRQLRELLRLRTAAKAAEEAITHTLVRAREDAHGLGYYLGPYTQSFEGLVRALALLLEKDVAEVRAAALGRKGGAS
jgi:hypothetical protein